MTEFNHTGSMDIDYAEERIIRRSSRYRLRRRTYEVTRALKKYISQPVERIVDLGTADGRLLHGVCEKFPESQCYGVEFTNALVGYGKLEFPDLDLVQGDIQNLPFSDNFFNAAIMTAVIEHVPAPGKALKEANRVLKPGGVLIVTSPDPFWEHVATMVGHLRDEYHQNVMNIAELSQLLRESGFNIIMAKKFMLSPIGLPYELIIENWIQKIGIDFILANQLLVAMRS